MLTIPSAFQSMLNFLCCNVSIVPCHIDAGHPNALGGVSADISRANFSAKDFLLVNKLCCWCHITVSLGSH